MGYWVDDQFQELRAHELPGKCPTVALPRGLKVIVDVQAI